MSDTLYICCAVLRMQSYPRAFVILGADQKDCRLPENIDFYVFYGKKKEDITWPRGDTKFLFECWKIFYEWAQRTSEIFFQHERRNFVSLSGYVMFYLLYKHQWNTQPFHCNSFFGVKGAIYYEAIGTVIFSHVKITCYFHVWRYQVFARKLTWYFIGVYIIKGISPFLDQWFCFSWVSVIIISCF